MKKYISIALAVLITVTVNAQVRVGVKGAWNYATGKAVYTGVKQSTSYIQGYGIGAMAKIPFDGVLHFSPSVMINKRGFTVNNPAGSANKKEQYSATYLDLIPALSADFDDRNNTFSISAAPVVGFTNFGKLKITDSSGITASQNMKFGFGAYGWFDLGLQAGISYRMKKVVIEAGYYTGLANINNQEETDGRNMQHRVITVSIGYYFKETGQ